MSALNLIGNPTAPVPALAAFARGEDVAITLTLQPWQAAAGWTVAFSLRAQTGDPAPLATVTLAVTDPVNGAFAGTLPSAATIGWAPGLYYYSVERLDAGFRTTLAEGPLNLLASQGP